LVTALPAAATTTAVVTVTNTPQHLAITITSTYNFNGISSRGTLVNTTYYSNPGGQTTAPSSTVLDAECALTVTNTSSVVTDLTANWSDMSGGSDNSTNGNTGTQGATTFGAYTYWSGIALASKVLCKSSASATAYSSLAANTNIKCGLQLNEQTNAWTAGTASTSTVTYTVTAH
jgi:hypothetical protein